MSEDHDEQFTEAVLDIFARLVELIASGAPLDSAEVLELIELAKTRMLE